MKVLRSITSLTVLIRSSNAVPFTKSQLFALRHRGGDSNDGKIGDRDGKIHVSSNIRQKLIGIVDLRPEPEPDSIIFHGSDSENHVQSASFPFAMASTSDDGGDDSRNVEAELDHHAASSHCIGNACSTVYLVIAYDFQNGKTVLHRSHGGAKLMAFVDGVRSYAHESIGDETGANHVDPTRLIVVLMPSSSSSATFLLEDLDSDGSADSGITLIDVSSDKAKEDSLDTSGATFLVKRLIEAFALGGDEYQSIEPFAVEIVGALLNRSKTPEDSTIKDVVMRHFWGALNGDHDESCKEEVTHEQFREMIQQTFESSGGSGVLFS